MFGKPLEQFFVRTIEEFRDSERALRQLASRAGAEGSAIVFRADQLKEARESLELARDHLLLAAKAGRSRFKDLVDEFEFVQEYLWSAYRFFLLAMMGPQS